MVDSFAKICFGFPILSFGNVIFQNIFYGTVVRHGEDSVTSHVYSHRSLREVDENAIHCINRNLSWTLELRNRYSDWSKSNITSTVAGLLFLLTTYTVLPTIPSREKGEVLETAL